MLNGKKPPADGNTAAQELERAVRMLYIGVAKLDLDTGEALILHEKGRPSGVGVYRAWDELLQKDIRALIPEADYGRLVGSFGLDRLREKYRRGKGIFSEDFTSRHKPQEKDRGYITVLVFFSGQEHAAYVLVRSAGEDQLLRSIVDMYVYDNCDFFMYLDAENDSYSLFSSKPGTQLPPEHCDHYEEELEGYVRRCIAPEDQERTLREMRLGYVQKQLETADRFNIVYGMVDSAGKYSRKRLDYRYYDPENKRLLVSRTDITAAYREEQARRRALEAALLRAQTDPLTRLWNFQAVMDRINASLESTQEQYGLLFVDMDNFKAINDTYGHPAGDDVLRAVAVALRQAVEPDDTVGRVGGDEFVVFARIRQSEAEIGQLAQRLGEALRSIRVPGSPEQGISCSIGAAIAPRDGRVYYTLVKTADAKLYQAKAEGKDRYCL